MKLGLYTTFLNIKSKCNFSPDISQRGQDFSKSLGLFLIPMYTASTGVTGHQCMLYEPPVLLPVPDCLSIV